MDKFQINLDELVSVVVPDGNKIPLAGNEHRIMRVAFDLFRFKDGNPEELWQVQSSDDGEFLVRTYALPEEEEEVKTSSDKWSVEIDKKEENLTVAYRNIPLIRLAKKDFAINNPEEMRLLQRLVFTKLSNNKDFVNNFVCSLSAEKQLILKDAGLNVFSDVDKKLLELESHLEKKAKSSEVEKLLDFNAKKMFGRGRKESIDKEICVVCGEDATKFDDADSEKEYKISGLCQKCQNATFSED